MSVLAIAKDQAGDLLRRRYFIVILILGLAIIGLYIAWLALIKRFAGAQPNMPPGTSAQNEMMTQVGVVFLQASLHALVAFIGTAVSVLLMCFAVRSEIARGTVRMVLSRPVRRYELVLGKWLGCVFIVFIYSLVMGVLVGVYDYYAFGRLLAFVPVSLAMGFFKAVLVGSVGMALSMVLNPFLSAVIAYFAAAETFLMISGFFSGAAEQIFRIPFYILPSYKSLDTFWQIMAGTSIETADVAYPVAHAMLYSGLMLLIACLLFRRRDLI